MNRLYVDSNTAKFKRHGLTTVDMELLDGRIIESLEPRRLFPISSQTRYISLLDFDLNEQALIRNIDELIPEDRKLILSCLEEYYLIPRITKINNIDDQRSKIIFDVETDRGHRIIEITHLVHQVKLLQDTRVLTRDANDNRFEIPDITLLDKKSRVSLDFYL